MENWFPFPISVRLIDAGDIIMSAAEQYWGMAAMTKKKNNQQIFFDIITPGKIRTAVSCGLTAAAIHMILCLLQIDENISKFARNLVSF